MWLKLTNAGDYKGIYINMDHVVMMMEEHWPSHMPQPIMVTMLRLDADDYEGNAGTVAVIETPEEIMRLINAAKA